LKTTPPPILCSAGTLQFWIEKNAKFVSATTALVVVVLSATLALLVLIGVGERIIAESLRKHRWTLLKVALGHQPAEPGTRI
jgi:hypothetical protein